MTSLMVFVLPYSHQACTAPLTREQHLQTIAMPAPAFHYNHKITDYSVWDLQERKGLDLQG